MGYDKWEDKPADDGVESMSVDERARKNARGVVINRGEQIMGLYFQRQSDDI